LKNPQNYFGGYFCGAPCRQQMEPNLRNSRNRTPSWASTCIRTICVAGVSYKLTEHVALHAETGIGVSLTCCCSASTVNVPVAPRMHSNILNWFECDEWESREMCRPTWCIPVMLVW